MNKDQVKGVAKEGMGKLQKKTGKLIGSPEQRVKGLAKEMEGKAQKNLGNAKETFDEADQRMQESEQKRENIHRER
jgi:uncharacterized protein YjbJ (UPF0337 family)